MNRRRSGYFLVTAFRALVLIFFTVALAPAVTAASTGVATVVNFEGDRPYKLIVPATYDKAKSAPLILALHGYTSTGDEVENYLKLESVLIRF